MLLMSERRGFQAGSRKAVFLTMLMLLASWSVALAGVPLASAHEADDVVSWPLSGSNDTGWVQLDAVLGSDPILSNQATADWVLEFAPGAEISNASLLQRTPLQPRMDFFSACLYSATC